MFYYTPECPEGEQLAPDGLSCVPSNPALGFAAPEPSIECPEGEQPTADGLGCEPIMAEEPVPVECDEGEELIDGQCQVILTEEQTAPEEEEPEEEEPEDGGDGDGGDGDGGDGDGGEGNNP